MKRPIVILLALLAAAPVLAEGPPPRPGDDGSNLLVTLTVTQGVGGGEKTIRVLLLDGQRSRVTTGWRIPTPTAFSATPGGGTHVAAIQYQDVGLDLRLHGRALGPGRVRIDGEIELSVLEPDSRAASRFDAPTVTGLRHVFDVVLTTGVGTTLAQMPDAGGGQVTLTIAADVQD